MRRCGQCIVPLVFLFVDSVHMLGSRLAVPSKNSTTNPGQVTFMSSLESSPRITPFLWFDNNAEDAVNFYLSVFKNSRRLDLLHNHEGQAAPAKVLTINFELDGQRFVALKGGPMFKFPEAVFFVVLCDS